MTKQRTMTEMENDEGGKLDLATEGKEQGQCIIL